MKTVQKTIAKNNTPVAKTENEKAAKTVTESVKTAETAAKEKAEIRKANAMQKTPLNLESTLQVLENLQSRMRQRNKLIYTIENLDSFEIDIKKESDELGGNHFQGCVLKLTDDNRNDFSTNNPVVIAAVANFVRDMCTQRLAEIEATIVLP